MSLFSEKLSHYVKVKKAKVYHLSLLAGVERTWLYKMLNGSRKPTDKEQVLRLAQALALTSKETEDLVNSYHILEIGEENWARRKKIQKLIESFTVSESFPAPDPVVPNFSLPAECHTQALHSTVNICRTLHSILLQESHLENGYIKMLVQPQFSFLVNCLTAILFDHTSIEHYICLENNLTSEMENLESIYLITPLLLNCKGYIPYGYYDHIATLFGPSSFLPNIVLTSQFLMRISSDYSEAVITDLPDLLQLADSHFSAQKSFSWPIFQMTQSFDEYLDLMLLDANISSSCCIMRHPCILSLLTPEILERIMECSTISSDISDLISQYQQLLFQGKITLHSWFSMEGLQQFYETGRFIEVPQELYSPLLQQEIYELLQSMCNLAREGKYHIHVTKPSSFELPPYLCIGVLENRHVTILFNHPQRGFWALDVNNLPLSAAICDFFQYIQEDKAMSYSEEESIEQVQCFLDELQ